MSNQNKENQNKDKNKDNIKNIINPTGDADTNNPANKPKEGGRNGGSQPSKGGRFGNASIEDGGTVEGSGAGSR